MRIKVCSLMLFLFGCYNNFLADSLLIQVKVVDDCIEAKILNNKIKGVKFYRGNLTKEMLSEEKEIKDVNGEIKYHLKKTVQSGLLSILKILKILN